MYMYIVGDEEKLSDDLPRVWIGVSFKLPDDQAYYYSPLVNEMEKWCQNNCRTDFHTVICNNNFIIVRFMCVKSNSCDQATMDAAAFKLRWL